KGTRHLAPSERLGFATSLAAFGLSALAVGALAVGALAFGSLTLGALALGVLALGGRDTQHDETHAAQPAEGATHLPSLANAAGPRQLTPTRRVARELGFRPGPRPSCV